MLKKIGISMAALCAALALANPPAAAAADRDDHHHYRPSYQYNEGRRAYRTYAPREQYRNDYWFQNDYRQNDYRNDRRDREWREHEWRERQRREQRQRWNYRDRDNDYYRYQR